MRRSKGGQATICSRFMKALAEEAYAAIVATATELELPWGGHVSTFVGVARCSRCRDRRRLIISMTMSRRCSRTEFSGNLHAGGRERRRLMALHADAGEQYPDTRARNTRDANGVAVVPTQMLWETFGGARDPDVLLERFENRYMPKSVIDNWYRRIQAIYGGADREASAREAHLRQELLKTMNDVGVEVLMGTDAPQVFSVPGFSLHRELPLMVESGMTPYEVLRTGTINVARHLGIEDRAGTIAVGKYADLLLLDDNPLEDIAAVAENSGVMIDGRWITPELITARLAEIEAKYAR